MANNRATWYVIINPNAGKRRGAKENWPVIHFEVDGESLGHSPIEIEILQKGIRIVAGEDFLP